MEAEELLADLAALSNDPVRFVRWAFPWGEEGGLKGFGDGPEPWQLRILERIRDGLLSPSDAIRLAVASGHGVGKSALVAWIILWAISTFEDTRGVVTANTERQLKTKTWAELGKWFGMFIAKDLFKHTATAIFSRERERTWRIDMIPWSENNTEAFAGLHNQGKRLLLLFDEASGIDDRIWQTAEGAMTDANTQIIWCVFGNPTQNTGRFRECFRRYAHRWFTMQVDSREVSFTNKSELAKLIEDNGEDSDEVRIRVLGQFPRVSSSQFISTELAEEAARRDVQEFSHDPLIIAVDVARFGDNDTVILARRGRDARTIPPITMRGADTMQVASRIADEYQRLRPDAVFVDEGGVGGGVVDRLRQLRVPVIGVQFGGRADRLGLEGDNAKYANKRAEIWGYMKEWLKGGAIPNRPEYIEQLTAPLYSYTLRDNAIQLETKDQMARRGVVSPDWADALAISFAYPVIPRELMGGREARGDGLVETDYDPFSMKAMAA